MLCEEVSIRWRFRCVAVLESGRSVRLKKR
jgi:hypothetical protein